MSDGIDSYLPDDSRTQGFVFVVLFLVVLPVVIILAEQAPNVLLAGIGVAFIALLFRAFGVLGDTAASVEAVDPLKTLQDRYARGEIDDEEFERRLDRLVEMENLELADAVDDPDVLLERER